MSELIESINAIMASRRMMQFFDGVEFKLEGREPVKIKIESLAKDSRSKGFRLTQRSVVTKVCSSNGIEAYGFGEHDIEIVALQKSIAEGVERCVLKLARRAGSDAKNSNGWAAHLTKSKAIASARNELFERDAALLHWLSATSFQEIAPSSWPKPLCSWVQEELSQSSEFNNLRILVSTLGVVPIVITIIQNDKGFGFVSQSGASTLEKAIYKSLDEVCRIADHGVARAHDEFSGSIPKNPEAHARYYAFQEKLPSWLFGEGIDFKSANLKWKAKLESNGRGAIRTQETFYKCGPIYVARCSSPDVQDLYFGSTESAVENGWINFDRLKKVCGLNTINLLPHFVP